MDGLVEIFLFCGVLYYFLNFRGHNMVDVLSVRLQEVYARWETRTDVTRNTEPPTTRFSIDGLRRAGQQLHRKRIQSREQAKKIRESSLFKIKESEPVVIPAIQKTSYLQYCCPGCTPSSRESLINTINTEKQSYESNILVIKPGPSIFSKIFDGISKVLDLKRYNYLKVTQTVLNDERLKDAIELEASDIMNNDGISEKKALEKAKARAKAILVRMESGISDTLLKITSWLLYKLLPCFIQSAVVQPSQIEVLKKANETGLPLIMLPLHRSHLDYIMISFILVINNIRNPLIAAGDNLKIPFFGWLLKGLGAFFIKRRIDPTAGRKDILYRATLQTYIMESLRAGHNIEFFVEGGRTRTGKPCMPKSGILSVIIDASMDGTIEDALLVPVAMNYERLVDGNFVREQLGQPKKMETFGSTIKALWNTLIGNYGIVKIDFCQPFSLAEMLKSFQAQQKKLCSDVLSPKNNPLKATMSSSSLYGTDVVVEEHRQLVDSVARHVVYDSSQSTPIMSTNVVAFLLLNQFRDGCTLDNLVEAFDSIRQELEWSNKDLAFSGESVDIINHAMDILGPGLISQQKQEITEALDGKSPKTRTVIAIRPVCVLPNVIELSYYSNTLLLYYLLESVVVTALYAELRSQINDPAAVAQDDITIHQECLIQRTLVACDILKYEFIFCKPCQRLEQVIVDTIRNLAHSGIISLKEEVYLEEELWSRRYAQTFDDSSDEEYSHEKNINKIQYKLNLDPEHSKRMEFLNMLLRPLIDTYTYSAFTLRKLVGCSLTEKDLIREILNEIKANVDSGVASYGESLGVDPIKNSLKVFEKWDVLECYPQGSVKIYYLKEQYDNDLAISKIHENIVAYKWNKSLD